MAHGHKLGVTLEMVLCGAREFASKLGGPNIDPGTSILVIRTALLHWTPHSKCQRCTCSAK